MPWYGFTLTGNGRVKPCCMYKGTTKSIYASSEEPITSLLVSEEYNQLRESFLRGEMPKSCSSCAQREEQINYSRRVWFKDKFSEYIDSSKMLKRVPEDFQFVQMDINLSNKCNLKCRMCGAWASSKWISDEVELASVSGNPYGRETREENLKLFEHSFERLRELVKNMKSVKRIDFKGGEPMLATQHMAFLDLLIAEGLASQVQLVYTTNGTVVNKKILDRLQKFSEVQISFSLEGTGDLYSYIRGNKYKIEDLRKAMEVYSQLPNVFLVSNVTIQAYNLFNLREIHEFLSEIELPNFSSKGAFNCIVDSPSYLSPMVWPMKERELAIKKISDIDDFSHFSKNLLDQPEDQRLFSKFIGFTKHLDRLRGESFLDLYPQFSSYFERSF